MVASTTKTTRIIFSIIHQVISTAFSTYNHQEYIIRSRSNHLLFIYQVIKFIIKPFVIGRGHIIPSLIRQSDALSPQKPLIHLRTSVSITQFFAQSLSRPFFRLYNLTFSLTFFSFLFLLHFAQNSISPSSLRCWITRSCFACRDRITSSSSFCFDINRKRIKLHVFHWKNVQLLSKY